MTGAAAALLVALLVAWAAVGPDTLRAQQSGPGILPGARSLGAGGAFTSPLLAPATPTNCSAPQYSFQGDTDTGFSTGGANDARICVQGSPVAIFTASVVQSAVGVKVTGAGTFTGLGLELTGDANPAVRAYNRTATAYLPLIYDALSHEFQDGGGTEVRLTIDNNAVTLGATTTLGWSDAPLARDAANTIAQRNGTNAQEWRLYSTFTDASNYERFRVEYDAGNVWWLIGSEFAGTGATSGVRVQAGSGILLNSNTSGDGSSTVIQNAGTTTWAFQAAGTLLSSGLAFASLGTPANGAIVYCPDCTKATPCAGSGSGALAVRLNGAWDCNP